MNDAFRDLKHSLRMFRQTPGFTLAAVAALTLGIGANTAIFSVVNSVLLKPLPYPDPDRLVVFLNVGPNGSGSAASVPKFNVWREQTPAFQDAAAYSFGVMNLTGGERPEQLPSARVTADFFRPFGAQTAVGRTFTADEDRPNAGKVVVLSHGFWQRRFAGDPQIVGRTLPLSGDSYVVIGVLAPSFNSAQFDPFADVWTPFQFRLRRAAARGDRRVRADVVLGGAAYAGDRDPPGAGRGGEPGPQHGAGSGMTLAVVGVIIGTAAAFGLSRLIESLLFGVTARDPIVLVGVPAGLSVVALAAVWLPALRATRIDPIDALRCE